MRMTVLAMFLAGMLPASTATADIPPINEVKSIDDGLFVIGLADQIRKNCPTISARVFRAIGALQDLNNQAKAMGYTNAEIDAHVESDVEKERLRARGRQYMADLGLKTDQAGYCALGKIEIDRNSSVGTLLRSSN